MSRLNTTSPLRLHRPCGDRPKGVYACEVTVSAAHGLTKGIQVSSLQPIVKTSIQDLRMQYRDVTPCSLYQLS
jgi:hypothetical protein